MYYQRANSRHILLPEASLELIVDRIVTYMVLLIEHTLEKQKKPFPGQLRAVLRDTHQRPVFISCHQLETCAAGFRPSCDASISTFCCPVVSPSPDLSEADLQDIEDLSPSGGKNVGSLDREHQTRNSPPFGVTITRTFSSHQAVRSRSPSFTKYRQRC